MDDYGRKKNIEALLNDAGKLSILNLAYVVQCLEDAEPTIVQINPNRKPYAVQSPTKQEWLERLRAMLEFVDGDVGLVWLRGLRLILPIIQIGECIDYHCMEGQIGLGAAEDLTARLMVLGGLVESDPR
ncbi:hypothetical protein ES703_07546 [subsurface metagenome]